MASLSSLSLCKSNSKTIILNDSRIHNPFCGYIKPHIQTSTFFNKQRRNKLTVVAVTEGSAKKSEQEGQPIPSWAKPDSEEPPPWARNEAQQQTSSTFELPFYVYLLASAITAIAAIGSVFEYINQKPVFGVLGTDSIFYAPVLGFFAITGIPTSGFLWYKSVEAANKEAEEQDRKDGYR
ncbi:putative Transmembrane protein [Heracleum sosnowskyi]|uniref:Transmembrane protein n=1 Tax=Heracleum sosnowskyi TaxID=360622 RepID=A0AAD8IHI8_9APIA|nr:putative Transmembrane protein [Heracleum sosnowskyi]